MTGLETASLSVCADIRGSATKINDQKVMAAKTQKTVIKITSLPIDVPTPASTSHTTFSVRITENHKLLNGANNIGQILPDYRIAHSLEKCLCSDEKSA